MSRILKKWTAKLGVSFLLASMVMAIFFGQSTHAQIEPCGTTVIGPGSCTITLVALNPSGKLTFSSVASVSVTNVGTMNPHIGTFGFNSTVTDERGEQAGWSLQASTPTGGLVGPGGTVPIHFNGVSGDGGTGPSRNTPEPLAGGDCGTSFVFSATLHSSSPVLFAQANPRTSGTVYCLYHLVTNGYVDFDSLQAGNYAGDVTITLASIA
jgi:hypothetical protein